MRFGRAIESPTAQPSPLIYNMLGFPPTEKCRQFRPTKLRKNSKVRPPTTSCRHALCIVTHHLGVNPFFGGSLTEGPISRGPETRKTCNHNMLWKPEKILSTAKKFFPPQSTSGATAPYGRGPGAPQAPSIVGLLDTRPGATGTLVKEEGWPQNFSARRTQPKHVNT